MTSYASLAQVKAELKADLTTNDAITQNYARIVSARIDLIMGQEDYFAPYIDTRYYEVDPRNVNSRKGILWLNDNLLAATAITAGTTALTLGSNVEYYPRAKTPYPALRLTDCCSNTWYSYACGADPCDLLEVTITGTFGYRTRYPTDGWLAADTLNGAINASVTTITVTDVDGADYYGITPRISAGNLLQIDSEWLEVTATNTTNNTATVRRAANGSTAAAHNNGATVSVWYPETVITRITARQAAALYARRGAFEGAVMTEVGIVTYPADLLSELVGVLSEFME